MDISFSTGSVGTFAKAKTNDNHGREKGSTSPPNDSGQFEIHTAKITPITEGFSRVARDDVGNANFRADRNYTKLETIVNRMEASIPLSDTAMRAEHHVVKARASV